ncbi:MAG: tRNA (guanosine(37)-N1)-methyltransferase TrmD [Phycisphaerales bacterium]
MRIDVLTTFPEMFAAEPPAALGVSIPARARAAGIVEVVATDIRAYAENKHAKTDDRPFGGGPGMVMMCQPIWDAARAVEAADPRPAHRVLMTPQGSPLTQATVERLAALPRLLVLAGHYEGIDERVIEALEPEEISIGDYVLSGGELAAMVLIDAVVRLLPGALGDQESALAESFSQASTAGVPGVAPGDGSQPRLLDCPHYTRPRVWEGREAPEILVSGDHAKVARWRLEQRLARTRDRRPDLLPADPQAGPADPVRQPPGPVDSPGTGS